MLLHFSMIIAAGCIWFVNSYTISSWPRKI